MELWEGVCEGVCVSGGGGGGCACSWILPPTVRNEFEKWWPWVVATVAAFDRNISPSLFNTRTSPPCILMNVLEMS